MHSVYITGITIHLCRKGQTMKRFIDKHAESFFAAVGAMMLGYAIGGLVVLYRWAIENGGLQ